MKSTYLCSKEGQASADVLHLLDTEDATVRPAKIFAGNNLEQLHQELSISKIGKQVIDYHVNLQNNSNSPY